MCRSLRSLLYLKNVMLPCCVCSDGTVSKALKYTTRLICPMNVAPFPFDSNDCSIQVSAGSSQAFVLLEPGGMELEKIPESYIAEIIGSGNIQLRTPLGLNQSSVSFRMLFINDPMYVSTTFISVAWALNLVSFGQVGDLHCPICREFIAGSTSLLLV